VFIVPISLLHKILYACQSQIDGIVAYTFVNVCEEIHQFMWSIKKMHTEENWFLFSASRCIHNAVLLDCSAAGTVDYLFPAHRAAVEFFVAAGDYVEQHRESVTDWVADAPSPHDNDETTTWRRRCPLSRAAILFRCDPLLLQT